MSSIRPRRHAHISNVMEKAAGERRKHLSHRVLVRLSRRPALARRVFIAISAATMIIGGCHYMISHFSSASISSDPYDASRAVLPGTFTPKPLVNGQWPTVDRSILEKLAEMDPADSDDDLPEDHHDYHRSGQWPPRVTRIPEQQPHSGAQISNLSLPEFDHSFCGEKACRYLLPLRIGEQESKARVHLQQLATLAASLNRILVLPNVAKSRLGACLHWSFDSYYDETIYQALATVDYMNLTTFQNWAAARPVESTTQLLYLTTKMPAEAETAEKFALPHSNLTAVFISEELSSQVDQRHRCLPNKMPRLALDAFLPTYLVGTQQNGSVSYLGDDIATTLYGNRLAVLAGKPKDTATADVLLVDFDLRYPIFSPDHESGLTAIEYSKNLSSISQNISTLLDGYAAVHWRMETVPTEHLSTCASQLIERLYEELAAADDLHSVWFASDYPYPISRSRAASSQGVGQNKSGTFKEISNKHEVAVEMLRSAFGKGGKLAKWKITGLHESLRLLKKAGAVGQLAEKDAEGEILLNDPGIWGILDKLVAIKSTVFISGAKGCGRVSSFTRQIIEERSALRGKSVSSIGNVVAYFG